MSLDFMRGCEGEMYQRGFLGVMYDLMGVLFACMVYKLYTRFSLVLSISGRIAES